MQNAEMQNAGMQAGMQDGPLLAFSILAFLHSCIDALTPDLP
jgi:hypothetical protein